MPTKICGMAVGQKINRLRINNICGTLYSNIQAHFVPQLRTDGLSKRLCQALYNYAASASASKAIWYASFKQGHFICEFQTSLLRLVTVCSVRRTPSWRSFFEKVADKLPSCSRCCGRGCQVRLLSQAQMSDKCLLTKFLWGGCRKTAKVFTLLWQDPEELPSQVVEPSSRW